MTLQLRNITFDCGDALNVATFWAAALGRQLDPGGSGAFCSIGSQQPGAGAPVWLFMQVLEPKQAKNRVHLDLQESSPSTVDELVALGARVVAEHEMPEHGLRWSVLQDPEGNEFCVSHGGA
jgi:predicted enzyme related to lactoylglutathione lyase